MECLEYLEWLRNGECMQWVNVNDNIPSLECACLVWDRFLGYQIAVWYDNYFHVNGRIMRDITCWSYLLRNPFL